VLVLIPAADFTLQAVARREGGEVRRIDSSPTSAAGSADAQSPLLAGTAGCEELWVFAGAPLDALDPGPATGVATSLTRLLAEEPRALPRTALFISAQAGGDRASAAPALPGSADELVALLKSGVRVAGLSGARATPELALQLAAQYPLVHFAVHGFEGESLQLAGEGGRLSAREIAHARLQPQARVVLSACEAGAPGPRGLGWAFARAGAAAVAAARGKVDDAAAARWSDRFYSALGRGLTFAQAAREAGKEDRAARFIVVK
jgi:CHAT domain-containing protein